MPPHNEKIYSDPVIRIPNETLVTIFNDFSATTLINVACASRRFCAVAERILYSSIHITDFLSGSSILPHKTIRWCESLLQRPHLLETTKKLHIRWQGESQPHASHELERAIENLAHVIQYLNSLESLEIYLGPANSLPHPERIHAVERVVRASCLTQLRSCSLGADWSKAVQPYTPVLDSFLTALSDLRHLRLPDHLSALNVPTEAMPHLSSFRGSADSAASLLPGRPVQYLSLVGQDSDVNRDNLLRMTLTSVPLRCLDLSAMSVRPMLLRNISAYLPTVESLRVRLALRHTLHYSFTGIRLLTGLSAVLSAFNQLSCLDLSPTGVEGADPMGELALCIEWARACPTLARVIFPAQTEWVLDVSGVWILVED